MEMSTSPKVVRFALQSRILVLLIQIFFNFLIPDHDAHVFNPPSGDPGNIIDECVDFILGGFRRWDAVYFIHIAEFGYTYENTLAFFPLFPYVIRLLANTVFIPLQFIMLYRNVLLISAYVINLYCFMQAAQCIHNLSLKVLQDGKLATKAVQLFSLNPASIFFSAAYSETMFAMFTLRGLLFLENGNFLAASLLFGLSGATRSNGLINLAFILYKQLQQLAGSLLSESKQSSPSKCKTLLINSCKTLLSSVLYTVIVATPFLLYQYHASSIYCHKIVTSASIPNHVLDYGTNQGYRMPHFGPPPWCKQTFPLSYSYVQNKYWNVGFLSYYEFKQIPNFLLALPVVIVTVLAAFTYFKNNSTFCLFLGLTRDQDEGHSKKTDGPVRQESETAKKYGYHRPRVFVYVAQMLALVSFGTVFMHVQVLTRFVCSSCPAFYFFLAWVTGPAPSHQDMTYDPQPVTQSDLNGSAPLPRDSPEYKDEAQTLSKTFMDWEENWVNKLIYLYFHLYFFVGICAFSNFLPWT